MNTVQIKMLAADDAVSSFAFEKDYRTYFESIGLGRSSRYYEWDCFQELFNTLLEEQNQALHYMYLVLDPQGKTVGRVNLTEVVQGPFKKAQLGYRIGNDHQGRGYATASVKLALEQAHHQHKLHRIEAGTSPANIGSQIVLIKNGFQFAGRYTKYILQGDQWHDSILFEKILDGASTTMT